MASSALPSNQQVEHIVDFIKHCGIQKSHLDNISKLNAQTNVVSMSMDLQSLIDLASLGVEHVDDIPDTPITIANAICYKSKELSDSIEMGLRYEYRNHMLNYFYILRLLSWIERYRFPNEAQKNTLVNSTRTITKAYYNWINASNHRHIPRSYVIGIALHFLYLDVYDDLILDRVYTDDRILKPVKDKKKNDLLRNTNDEGVIDMYQLDPRIVHDQQTDQVIHIRRAFQMVNGILEVNYPSYLKAGRSIHRSHIQYLNSWFGKQK